MIWVKKFDVEKLQKLIEQGDSMKTIQMKMECCHATVKKYAEQISPKHLDMLVENGKAAKKRAKHLGRFNGCKV